MLTHKEYLALVKRVNEYRNEINLFNIEEISEEALDNLKHQITEFENANPELLDPNSPNMKVAGGVAEGFQKFTHSRRMLSLNDIFSFEELQDWQERWQDYAQRNGVSYNKAEEYICEPKVDGLAISLHYEKGLLITAVTRGDGFVGENVTENIKQIANIPKVIDDQRKIEVRGEIFMTKSDFEKLNHDILHGKKIGKMGKTSEEGLFANHRNVASGTVRQLDSRIVATRNLSFIAYGIWVEGI
jgi:DNA ligase (NAD+)